MANLLLVDDDNDVVDTYAQILRDAGHEVRTASNGELGLELLRAAPLPEAIVLDVDMPVMSGPKMAHKMFVHDSGEEKIPVVLMSASADLPQIAEQMGTPYFLAKAGDIGAFLAMIDRALRERVPPSSA